MQAKSVDNQVAICETEPENFQDQNFANDQQKKQQQQQQTAPINEDANEIQQLEEIGIKVLNHWQTGDLPGDSLNQKADDEICS